jgi:hypothetical protein
MEIPHFMELHREISTNDLVIVGISTEDQDVLSRFVAAKRIGYAIAQPTAAGLPVPYSEIRSIPTTFFIDRQGVIENVAVGYLDLGTLRSFALGSEAPDAARPPSATPP